MEVIEIGSQEELDEFVRRWTEEIERLKTWNSELADACDDLRAERGGLKRRVAELEAENAGLRAALEPFAEYAELFDGWDYPTAPNTPLSVDIDYTCDLCLRVQDFRRARAALEGDAPKEERCHVWGGDVSRWKLPEFAPTGNAGDPGARMKCCAACRWMSLSWADRILLGRSAAICTHPKTGRQDPVSGQIIGQGARCSLVRRGRLPWIDGDSCGPEGRWWEAKG